LSPRVQLHIDQFEHQINQIAERYESGNISDDEVKNELKRICQTRAGLIKFDANLSVANRAELSEIFYVMDAIADDVSLVLQDPSLPNGFTKSKFGRAFLRVILVAAVTVAFVYTAGLATGVVKMKSLYLAHKGGLAAITTKTKVAGGKMYSALYYGLGKGMIGVRSKMG